VSPIIWMTPYTEGLSLYAVVQHSFCINGKIEVLKKVWISFFIAACDINNSRILDVLFWNSKKKDCQQKKCKFYERDGKKQVSQAVGWWWWRTIFFQSERSFVIEMGGKNSKQRDLLEGSTWLRTVVQHYQVIKASFFALPFNW